MIFSLILVIKILLVLNLKKYSKLAESLHHIGFLLGGAVIYWFTGASIQAVTTGAAGS
jgi:K(+)-stimulated pyrophosphate-energized sodium pump